MGFSKYSASADRSSARVISCAMRVLPLPGLPAMRTSAPSARLSAPRALAIRASCDRPGTNRRAMSSDVDAHWEWARNGTSDTPPNRLCSAG